MSDEENENTSIFTFKELVEKIKSSREDVLKSIEHMISNNLMIKVWDKEKKEYVYEMTFYGYFLIVIRKERERQLRTSEPKHDEENPNCFGCNFPDEQFTLFSPDIQDQLCELHWYMYQARLRGM